MKLILALIFGLSFISAADANGTHTAYLQLDCLNCHAPVLRKPTEPNQRTLQPPPARPVANPPKAHR